MICQEQRPVLAASRNRSQIIDEVASTISVQVEEQIELIGPDRI